MAACGVQSPATIARLTMRAARLESLLTMTCEPLGSSDPERLRDRKRHLGRHVDTDKPGDPVLPE